MKIENVFHIALAFVLASGLPSVMASPSVVKSASAPSPSLQKVLEHYAKIESSLAQDKLMGIREAAESLTVHARSLEDRELGKAVEKSAKALISSVGADSGHGSLLRVREDFKGLSEMLSAELKKRPVQGWSVYHCPMVKSDWIQKADSEIQNPYYGSEMKTCGTKVQ